METNYLMETNKNQINLHLPEGYDGTPVEVVIREGEANKLLDDKEPRIINIGGTIGAVYEWLEKRISLIQQHNSHLLVNRDEMTLDLFINEDSFYRTHIGGTIETSKELEMFGINNGKKWQPSNLSLFVKMNRTYFLDRSENMTLVSTLKNFKAKMQKLESFRMKLKI